MADIKAARESPLKIAVIGAGGIGSTFAYYLAQAGHELTVVARPGSRRLAQLQRDNGVVTKDGRRQAMAVTDLLDESTSYDLVVVTTLAHQVDAVLLSLSRSQAGAVQFMFNTFEPERLRDALGYHRCSFGMPFVATTVDGDGALQATINPGQKTLHGDLRWAKLFQNAGLPSSFEVDMPLWLRCHTPMCVAMESICALGQQRGGGATWAEALTVAGGVQASYAVIAALGYRVYPASKARLNALPAMVIASMLWSVSRIRPFRELLATGVNECCALADAMASAARRASPPVPAATSAILAMKPTGGANVGDS